MTKTNNNTRVLTVKKSLVTIISTLVCSSTLAGGSPWLNEYQTTDLNVSYIYQTADELYVGKQKNDLPDDLILESYIVSLNHSFTDNLQVGIKTGYAKSEFDPRPFSDEGGRTDSQIAISWRVVDEFITETNLPTVTLRSALIIDGNYNTGSIDAIGDGGNGIEGSVLLGKNFTPKLAASAELGYRYRSSNVRNDNFYGVSLFYSLSSQISFSAGYEWSDGRGGLDIGGPEFSPDRFHETDEESEILTLGVNYNLENQWNISAFYLDTQDGRNIAKQEGWALSLGYSF